VFRLTPSGTGWSEKVLYSFCSQTNCADGAGPEADLIMDGAGNFYGTTLGGGNASSTGCVFDYGGCGVVFKLNPGPTATLSVSVIGSPGGSVTSSPSGINCGSTCSASFDTGTQVTLTATPSTAWGLAGWGGACSGIGKCTVTINANASVSASFTTFFATPLVPQLDPALPPPVLSPLPVPRAAF
jgi:hypothetical protein